MACRFPGAATLDAFWQLLTDGGNAVQEGVPGSGVGRMAELFPTADVQNDACRFCAFVDDIDKFDAAFFRISPVEAELLDPQQRIMLETSWQALEDAGIDPERLRGSRTGVYAGISNNEYRSLALDVAESAEPASSLYAVSGTSLNTAIGRVAFAMDFAGPAMAVDTACSSALVAIHQAVSGLQRGEADLALAGGVNNILSGRLLELRGNAGMLAPDGQCKTFDARANGYVRGEGCGLVVLKRLAEAERDGDRIWAVVRGSAVNQDGASPGLTVPSGDAQARVIQAALARAGMQPQDVDYLEAHGTGTPVGDPIEADAAATAYGPGRPADRPLLIGSVKTNIGHLESAAGVAGFMKAVMALRHGVIPRHLNFETTESGHRLGPAPPRGHRGGDGLAAPEGTRALRRRERLRVVGHQRARPARTLRGADGNCRRERPGLRRAPDAGGDAGRREGGDAAGAVAAAIRQDRRCTARIGRTLPDLARWTRSPPPSPTPRGRRASDAAISISGPASSFAMRTRCGSVLPRSSIRTNGSSWRRRRGASSPLRIPARPASGSAWGGRSTRPSPSSVPFSTGAMPCSAKIAAPRCST